MNLFAPLHYTLILLLLLYVLAEARDCLNTGLKLLVNRYFSVYSLSLRTLHTYLYNTETIKF